MYVVLRYVNKYLAKVLNHYTESDYLGQVCRKFRNRLAGAKTNFNSLCAAGPQKVK